MIQIEKDYPVPEGRRPRKYPWREMEVGDSFFTPFTDTSPENARAAVYAANKRYNGARFKGTVWTENGVDGTRIWRIS